MPITVAVGQSVVFTNKISGEIKKEAGFIASLTQDSDGNPTATVTVLNSVTGLAEGYSGIPLVAGDVTNFADASYAGYVNLTDKPDEIAIPVSQVEQPAEAEEGEADKEAG